MRCSYHVSTFRFEYVIESDLEDMSDDGSLKQNSAKDFNRAEGAVCCMRVPCPGRNYLLIQGSYHEVPAFRWFSLP